MGLKECIANLSDKIQQIYDSEDVYTAREKVKSEIAFWQGEVEQMGEDRENRIIFAAGVVAAFLMGFMLGILL